jgi:hypothetical protein
MRPGLKLRLAFAAAASLALPAASLATGPLGAWMLTDGDAKKDALIQGTSVTVFDQDPNSNLQYAIQWDPINNVFETVGRDLNQFGGVYQIDHTLVGEFGNYSTVEGQHTDGTLDTLDSFTYASNFTTGDVIKYVDANFNSPSTSIYNAGAGNLFSITYDSVLDTLFLGQSGSITQIDKSGQVIGSFNTLGGGPVRSLAYDALDDTMWYLSYDGNTAYQTNANGDNLSSFAVNLGGNYFGGEIAAVPGAVPGPMALIPFAIGGLSMIARRRRSKK